MEYKQLIPDKTKDILVKPHRRLNILTNEWVLISPHRTQRPWQGQTESLQIEKRPTYDESCYLCPGNHRAQGAMNDSYDETYVFDNDFAAILPDTPIAQYQENLLQASGEKGICRVICFSPDHSLTMAEMSVSDIGKVIRTWKEQFRELSAISWINNVQIFENKGAAMGCSNPHPHGQIWAQSSVPNEISKRTVTQNNYYHRNNSSLLGDYLIQELASAERIVCQNEHFVCLVPFWAVWPYETMIIPKRHFQSILEITEPEVESFAQILSDITIRYDNLFQCSFPYSAGIQQRPSGVDDYSGWHFHYAFYPPLLRSAEVKKFMVGYEMFANAQRDITPEAAAATLRSLSTIHFRSK